MAMNRRQWISRSLAVAVVPALAVVTRHVLAQPAANEQVIKIVAQRFHYTPGEFQVKAAQPVVLEFTSLDFVHGFSMPDMKVRADLPPGIVTRVRFTVDKPGVYDFLCDNFCGDNHEEMNGRMIAVA